jgi:hypothetical protein
LTDSILRHTKEGKPAGSAGSAVRVRIEIGKKDAVVAVGGAAGALGGCHGASRSTTRESDHFKALMITLSYGSDDDNDDGGNILIFYRTTIPPKG